MLGLTWKTLGEEIGHAQGSGKPVARNTLRALHRMPHYNPGKTLITALATVHSIHCPSPYPKGVNALMSTVRLLMQEHETNRQLLNNIELHVIELLCNSQHPALTSCRLNWILGNINQFRMRAARLGKRRSSDILRYQHNAIKHFTSALDFIDAHQLPLEHYKLIHNLFVCHVNAVPEIERSNNTVLTEQLLKIPYLESAHQALEQEPFQWQTARNGLLYASITANRQAVASFFELLVRANALFSDLEYRPLGTDSIREDKSLKWAASHVLTPSLVDSLNDKLQRNK